MSAESEFIQAEIPEVRKIVQDECWLEGERRGAAVDPRDDAIQKRVAEIILSGVGAQLRSSVHPSVNSDIPKTAGTDLEEVVREFTDIKAALDAH